MVPLPGVLQCPACAGGGSCISPWHSPWQGVGSTREGARPGSPVACWCQDHMVTLAGVQGANLALLSSSPCWVLLQGRVRAELGLSGMEGAAGMLKCLEHLAGGGFAGGSVLHPVAAGSRCLGLACWSRTVVLRDPSEVINTGLGARTPGF